MKTIFLLMTLAFSSLALAADHECVASKDVYTMNSPGTVTTEIPLTMYVDSFQNRNYKAQDGDVVLHGTIAESKNLPTIAYAVITVGNERQIRTQVWTEKDKVLTHSIQVSSIEAVTTYFLSCKIGGLPYIQAE